MAKVSRDEERETPIMMEIIVDAYDPEEQAMGSTTTCRTQYNFRSQQPASVSNASSLKEDITVETVDMAPEGEYEQEGVLCIPPRKGISHIETIKSYHDF